MLSFFSLNEDVNKIQNKFPQKIELLNCYNNDERFKINYYCKRLL